MRDYMASVGLTPDQIDHNVHELYMTNQTEFAAGGERTSNPRKPALPVVSL